MKLGPQIAIGSVAIGIMELSGCSTNIGDKIRIKFKTLTPHYLICFTIPGSLLNLGWEARILMTHLKTLPLYAGIT